MSKAELSVKTLSDEELQVIVEQGQAELVARDKRRKEETIAKIRALAGEAGLAVTIEGARGRPGGRGLKKRGVPAATSSSG